MDAESKNETPPAPSLRPRHILVPLLVAIPLMLTFITIPTAPVDLNTDADTSFSAVMDYSLEHALHFGTALVNVYGPLAHLLFYYVAPHAIGLRMTTDIVLGYTVAAGLCLVAWRLHWLARCFFLGIFIFVITNMYPRGDLVIDAGSFCWGLLCCVQSGRRLRVSAAIFTALAVFAALAKNSFLFTSGCSLALLALLLAAQGRWRLSLAMIAGFGAGVSAGWITMGPGLPRLPESAMNVISVVQAYNQAMGWDVLPIFIETGVLALALTIMMIVLRAAVAFGPNGRLRPLRRALLLAWLLALLFFSWKHGFVRGDIWHVAYFFGFVPVLALGLEMLPTDCATGVRWARWLAVGCCATCLFVLQLTYFPSPLRSLATPFRALAEHTRDVLRPGAYRRRINDVIEDDRKKADLPQLRKIIGNAGVDVFGQLQIYALLNGLNYHPRPVFQSYVACNARLARLNEQFFLSGNAPKCLLFALGPIDRRFPALEDPMLLRDVLFNFKPIGAEGPFLLLESDTPAPTRMTLVREGETQPGEVISIRDLADANLWMEIELTPSLLGRLRQFFYRTPTVRLAAWGEGRLLLKRRAPPLMLAAGFVASPLLSRNEDLENFYSGKPMARPTGYSVELLPGEDHLWRKGIHFRIYKIEKGAKAGGGRK